MPFVTFGHSMEDMSIPPRVKDVLSIVGIFGAFIIVSVGHGLVKAQIRAGKESERIRDMIMKK